MKKTIIIPILMMALISFVVCASLSVTQNYPGEYAILTSVTARFNWTTTAQSPESKYANCSVYTKTATGNWTKSIQNINSTNNTMQSQTVALSDSTRYRWLVECKDYQTNVSANSTMRLFDVDVKYNVLSLGVDKKINFTLDAGNESLSGSLLVSDMVGVGTNSPNYNVHIREPSTDASYVVVDAGSGTFVAALGSQNSPGVAQETFVGSITNTSFKIKTVNTERMRITNEGKVGIGVTIPSAELEVGGTVDQTLLLNRTSSTGLKIESASSGGYVQTVTNNKLILGVNSGTDDLVIDTTGNVGIGTATPSTNLHVAGNAMIDGILYVGGNITSINRTSTVVNSTLIVTDEIGVPKIILNGTTGSTKVKVLGSSVFGSTVDGLWIAPSTGYSSIVGLDSESSGYNDIDIRASAGTGSGVYLKTNGNVGIGTTSPLSTLHLAASNDPAIAFNDTSWGPAANVIFGVDTSDGNFKFSKGHSLGTTTIMAFNYTTRSVGIGIDSPGDLLDVYGNLSVSGYLQDSRGTVLSIGANDDISFNDNQAILASNTGYFGVNTKVPAARLHINESALNVPVVLEGSSGGSLILFKGAGVSKGYMGWTTLGDDGLGILSDGTYVDILLTASRKIGLGMTTPETKVHINGTLTLEDSLNNTNTLVIRDANKQNRVVAGTGTNGAGLVAIYDNVGDLDIYLPTTGNAYFRPTGYVGFGTSSPTAYVDIIGGDNAFKVRDLSGKSVLTINATKKVALLNATFQIGEGLEQINLTLTSPNGNEFCCGVSDAGAFVCSAGACLI